MKSRTVRGDDAPSSLAMLPDGLSPLISESDLWGRWLRVANVVSTEEPLLNLNRDLIQPSLGPVCPLLVMADACLKFSYPVFSGSNFSR